MEVKLPAAIRRERDAILAEVHRLRITPLDAAMIVEAFNDWCANRAFLRKCGRGYAYFLKREQGRAIRAPWSALVLRVYPDNARFHALAHLHVAAQKVGR